MTRESDRLLGKTRHLVPDLLDAISLEDVVSTVEDSLRHELQVPYVGLILFNDSNVSVGHLMSSTETHQAIGGLLSGGETVCGVLRPYELTFLFDESDRDETGSAAVILLGFQGLHGVLVIGSSDPQCYESPLSTLFLGYVAKVPVRMLLRFSSPLRSVR